MGVENILKLVDLINSLPPTKVQNETAVNQMQFIKAERRHRLSNYNLNATMVMRIESHSILELNPTTAMTIWMVTPLEQKRRTGYNRTPKTAAEQNLQLTLLRSKNLKRLLTPLRRYMLKLLTRLNLQLLTPLKRYYEDNGSESTNTMNNEPETNIKILSETSMNTDNSRTKDYDDHGDNESDFELEQSTIISSL